MYWLLNKLEVKNKKDDRYQNQIFLIKIYRWIIWKPLFFMKASFYILKTFFNKNLLWDPDEKAYFKRYFIFKLIYDEASSKMKYYYHDYEVFGRNF